MGAKVIIIVDSDAPPALLQACQQLAGVVAQGRCQAVALALTEWDSAEHILSVLAAEGRARVVQRNVPALAEEEPLRSATHLEPSHVVALV